MIRLVKKSDLNDLAIIYKNLYDNADIGENWTIEKAYELLLYWFDKQKDLFFVAVEDDKPVGAIVSGVKSWFDGLRLIDTEIFVSEEYQGKHIAKNLMLVHLKEAKIKYNVNVIEFHTYGEEDEFPQNWYNRIGFKKDDELIIMSANVEKVLNELGYFNKEKYNNDSKYISEPKNVVSCSYQELSNLYSNLGVGDTAYIFEMLPNYAYQDNDLEREYLESIKTAMRNGAVVNMFIVGNKEKFNNLESNELYNYTLNNCYNNSKIYIINEEEIKEKCLDEYFQLAQGLYFGKRKDGKCEIFRDLWVNTDNIGLIIRDESILEHIENTINNIVNKINNNEIKIEKLIEGEVSE
ncbi:MAG: GNAT family N-acetyltransferase [Bacilli bacterium]|nr:GNAT family N-acetyltransferase [Bacilli bacterium]